MACGLIPPPDPTLVIPIKIDFYNNSKGVNVAHFNDVSMQIYHDKTFGPLLDRVANGATLEGMSNMNVLKYSSSEVVELVIDNYDGGEHPIHIHGRRLYVIARGKADDGPYNASIHTLNTVDPYVRDTITVEASSYIVLRFADKNPGLWMVHCHIDWHLVAGLAMILYELPASDDDAVAIDMKDFKYKAMIIQAVLGSLLAVVFFGALGYAYYIIFVKKSFLMGSSNMTKEKGSAVCAGGPDDPYVDPVSIADDVEARKEESKAMEPLDMSA
jgi:Multicopper oxidase